MTNIPCKHSNPPCHRCLQAREYQERYRLTHQQKVKEDKARWFQRQTAEQRKRHNQRSRAWQKSNPDRYRVIRARFRELHREEEREKARSFRAANLGRERRRESDWKRSNYIKVRAYARRSYLKHAEKRRADARTYRLAHREELKAKYKASWPAYYKAHKKQIIASVRKTMARRRAQKRSAAACDNIDPKAVYERDLWLCYLCGAACTKKTSTMDHVVPLAAGGSHTYENVVTACRSCNSAKRDRPLILYMVGIPQRRVG